MKFIVYSGDHRAEKAGEILRGYGSTVVTWNPSVNKIEKDDVVLFSSSGIFKRGGWVRVGYKPTDPEVKKISLPDWATSGDFKAAVAINTDKAPEGVEDQRFKEALYHVRLQYDPTARILEDAKPRRSRHKWTSGHTARRLAEMRNNIRAGIVS
jgi:hypothetical protein